MSKISPGFRFYPTEEELISFYLKNKLEGRRPDMERVVPVAEVYNFDPWQLPYPGMSGAANIEDFGQWFFFCPRQQREAHGGRPTRTTPSGYWKATGSPSCVYSNNKAIGMKRSMVFYLGRAPTGTKTEWKMNEYKAFDEDHATASSASPPKLRSEFSVCRVYDKSGSLRSFDRRPLGNAVINAQNPNSGVHSARPTPDDASSSRGQTSLAGRASSLDSSSSGDDAQVRRAADGEMLEDIDWEGLEWP